MRLVWVSFTPTFVLCFSFPSSPCFGYLVRECIITPISVRGSKELQRIYIQCIGVPAVLERSVVLGSHTGSGKTLAYMLLLVQLLRGDEALSGMLRKPRRSRAVVLCPTRELSEQVFRVAKSISHHARFRSTMGSSTHWGREYQPLFESRQKSG